MLRAEVFRSQRMKFLCWVRCFYFSCFLLFKRLNGDEAEHFKAHYRDISL